jgi:hypothetical protein
MTSKKLALGCTPQRQSEFEISSANYANGYQSARHKLRSNILVARDVWILLRPHDVPV